MFAGFLKKTIESGHFGALFFKKENLILLNNDKKRVLLSYILAHLIFLWMFIFAHLVCGLLLGLGFCCLIHDRRAIPVCMISSLIPDIIDKPLGMLIPELSRGRTYFHSLLIVLIAAIIILVLIKNRYMLWGIAVACCIFSHQLLDGMWQLPSMWLYPFFGPFPVAPPPDYAGYYLWLEVTSPSEWIFLLATVVMMSRIFLTGPYITDDWYFFWRGTIVLLAGMGILMVVASLCGAGNTFFAPSYSEVTSFMTGILALAGALVMWQWHRLKPCNIF